MATLSCSSSHLILQRFIFRRPTLSFSPFSVIFQAKAAKQCFPLPLTATPSFSSTRSLFSSPTPQCAISQPLAAAEDVALLENEPTESEKETNTAAAAGGLKNSNLAVAKTPPPSLTVKEKKELASYAHSLGKKLKSQQVGKSGVTDTVITALIETLEANELLKLKVHGTCPAELEDVVKLLEEATGSVVVSQIGRTLILYRPSLTKLKAEEKKKQNQIAYLKKQQMSRPWSQSKRPVSVQGQEQRQFGRGRRGSNRP